MTEKFNGNFEDKASERLKNLIIVNQHFAEIELLDELFPVMLDLAKAVTEAEVASLLLYNSKQNILEFVASTDEVFEEGSIEFLKKSAKLQLGEGISGWVAQNRQPLIIEDAQNDFRFQSSVDKKMGFVTRNVLAVPLVYKDKLLGVLNVLNSINKKTFDFEDQEVLSGYAHLASVAIIRSQLIETRVEQLRFETQMTTAAKIQSLFWTDLPELGNGSHAWARSIPATFVGGDLYDFLPMNDGSWIFYVADVSDKGLPAAMIMVALWSKIRAEVPLHKDIESLLENVNRAMYELLSEEGFFATIILGKYHPEDGHLSLVRSGHTFPLYIKEGSLKEIPKLKGVALGVTENAAFQKEEITLSPGESIVFLSDGVTEAENESCELFGDQRVAESIKTSTSPPWSKRVLYAVEDWQGAAKPSDDLTILEVWREP